MTIKECYDAAGGNYNEILGRFLTEARVAKFAVKFLNDGTYNDIMKSLGEQDWETAFRAAHTLKGVSQNLSFTDLYEISHELTEMLRPLQPVDTSEITGRLTVAYNKVIDAVSEFQRTNS